MAATGSELTTLNQVKSYLRSSRFYQDCVKPRLPNSVAATWNQSAEGQILKPNDYTAGQIIIPLHASQYDSIVLFINLSMRGASSFDVTFPAHIELTKDLFTTDSSQEEYGYTVLPWNTSQGTAMYLTRITKKSVTQGRAQYTGIRFAISSDDTWYDDVNVNIVYSYFLYKTYQIN